MINYDTDQMHTQVDKVRKWADSTLVCSTVLGILLGACGGHGIFMSTGGKTDDLGPPFAVCLLIGRPTDFLVGYGCSFIIRLVGHTMLCLAQTEQNISSLRCNLRKESRTTNGAPQDCLLTMPTRVSDASTL